MGIIITILAIVIIIPIILILWIIGSYNGLIKKRNRLQNAFSQIDVQLKRRYDLIPNLVKAVKKIMSHERETLEAVIQARNQANIARQGVAINPGDEGAMTSLMSAETALTGTIGKLFALQESYPELKANENMMQFSEELSTTENRLAFARQAYNDAVTRYNTARETFPTSFIANTFKFKPAVLFEISDEKQREAIDASFD